MKDELCRVITTCIEKGSDIMTRWAAKNLTLLIKKRCLTFLKESVQVLDGLTSLYTDIIGTPLWPSVDDKFLTIFMLKIYLSNIYINIDDVSNFLETSPEQILNIGAQLLLNTSSEADTKKIIDSLKLTDIDMEEYTDNTLITEVLLNFDQILRFTTLDLWKQHKDKTRQTTAGFNLNAKMKALKTINATEATALAIAKAAENAKTSQLTTLESNLRLSNLERSAHKQEQKSNEIINQIKRNQLQKNLSGSHAKESLASPERQTPSLTKTKNKRQLVDLTTEDEENTTTEERQAHLKRKKLKQTKAQPKGPPLRIPQKTKTVQWKETEEVKHFHPNQPAINPGDQQGLQNPFATLSYPIQSPPAFQPAPPPSTFSHQQAPHISNPFYPVQNQTTGFGLNPYHMMQTPYPYLHPAMHHLQPNHQTLSTGLPQQQITTQHPFGYTNPNQNAATNRNSPFTPSLTQLQRK